MAANNTRGFTLIELIISIVLIAIALSVVVSFVAPQAQQSAAPLVQLRAVELGQGLMNEILAKSFDEHSERVPPFRRCDEIALGASACTASDELGPDSGETRTRYNDVDDYIALTGVPITNSLGQELTDYSAYSLRVDVQYDSDLSEVSSQDGTQFKRITIEVTSAQGQVFGFTSYKGNF